jgi:hypothetical protein
MLMPNLFVRVGALTSVFRVACPRSSTLYIFMFGPQDFTPFLGDYSQLASIIMLLYCFCGSIVLLNLLIALMVRPPPLDDEK